MASSFPKMQKSSASFSQSIRNRLRLKKLQAQAKNFCRVLDIRVPELVRRKRLNRLYLWVASACILPPCCNVQIVLVTSPCGLKSRVRHRTARLHGRTYQHGSAAAILQSRNDRVRDLDCPVPSFTLWWFYLRRVANKANGLVYGKALVFCVHIAPSQGEQLTPAQPAIHHQKRRKPHPVALPSLYKEPLLLFCQWLPFLCFHIGNLYTRKDIAHQNIVVKRQFEHSRRRDLRLFHARLR